MAQSRHSLCSSLPFSSTFSHFRDINRQLDENCTCKDNVVYIIVRRNNCVKDAAPIVSFPHIKRSFFAWLKRPKHPWYFTNHQFYWPKHAMPSYKDDPRWPFRCLLYPNVPETILKWYLRRISIFLLSTLTKASPVVSREEF